MQKNIGHNAFAGKKDQLNYICLFITIKIFIDLRFIEITY